MEVIYNIVYNNNDLKLKVMLSDVTFDGCQCMDYEIDDIWILNFRSKAIRLYHTSKLYKEIVGMLWYSLEFMAAIEVTKISDVAEMRYERIRDAVAPNFIR